MSNPVKALDRVILGQYPNYVSDELPVAEINYDKFTHLVYFSLSPYSSGNLNTNNVDTLDLQEFVTNAKANGIKAMIDVGGWGRSTYFSDMAADTVSRARFVTNIKQF
ncbi:MAG: glycosyl hydrolase family 18 protein, partial [Planctomycetota bacterium]